MTTEDHVRSYWMTHYVNKDGLCSLCGNTGYVETVDIKSTGALTHCHSDKTQGNKIYCFCPNGQGYRAKNSVYDETAKHLEDKDND